MTIVPLPLSLQLLLEVARLASLWLFTGRHRHRFHLAPSTRAAGFAIALMVVPAAMATALTGDSETAGSGGADSAHALESFVRAQVGEHHRVEIRFGDLPANTKLAPCQKIEPFLASGARLWGNSRIGVRCLSGANWSISLPVSVRVFGLGLITTRPLSARAAVTSEDVRLDEIELTRLNGKPLTDAAALDGVMTVRNLQAGQPLLSFHVKQRPTVAVGDPVRVRVVGEGFSIVANGSALAPGTEGNALRVRTDAGRVVVGTLNGQTVDITP